MVNIYNIDIMDILPESLKNDSQVQAMCAAITPQLQDISNLISQCILISKIDKLPEEVVDLLAYQFHVDFYEPTDRVEKKRQLVENSLPWHVRKGTLLAVQELITTYFDDGEIVEWFKYGGDPYKFKVVTNNKDATSEKAVQFTRLLDSVKNTRSWLEAVEITQTENVNLFMADVVHIGDFETIRQVD